MRSPRSTTSKAGLSKRPWTAKDYPHVAAWLKANDKPLALIVEASRRPVYFNPLVPRRNEKEPATLSGAPFGDVVKFGEPARALTARALLRIGEGKFEEARQDLLACHRLGRLLARGSTLVEALVGFATDFRASRADLAYLEHGNLTPQQLQHFLNELRTLPAMPSLADKYELAERFLYLDSVQVLRRGGSAMLEGMMLGKPWKLDAEELKALEKLDWVTVLRNGNRSYDKVVAALCCKDRQGREKALLLIGADPKAQGLGDLGLAPPIQCSGEGAARQADLPGGQRLPPRHADFRRPPCTRTPRIESSRCITTCTSLAPWPVTTATTGTTRPSWTLSLPNTWQRSLMISFPASR